MKKVIAGLIFLVCMRDMMAQNGVTGSPDWQFKGSFSTGFIMVHRISIGHLVKGYPATYELSVSKPTLGNKLWHHENNRPDLGVTFQCLDFRNPKELGYAFILAPYMEIPLSDRDRWWRLHMRLCWGLTYITKHFDIETNRKNVAIGSNLNVFAQFRWFLRIPAGKHTIFEPGITFSHTSNGRARVPNLGLNLMSLTLALNYLVPEKRTDFQGTPDSTARNRSRNELLAFAATGFNQKNIKGELMDSYMMSVAYQRNVRNTHKFSAGIDFYLDRNFALDFEEITGRAPQGFEAVRASARLGYSYNAGRVSFPIEIGYYILEKVSPDAPVVSRIGVRYYAASGIVAHFGLRTHFAVAYNFEFGVGYRLFLKRK